MHYLRAVVICVLLAFGCFTVLPAQESFAAAQAGMEYPDPSRFETAIEAFEKESKETPPPEGAIVCIGSSSMRMWTSIREDLEPLTVIPRGFGGSTMKDALYYADRIVIPYKPRAVLLYEGDNDAAYGISPKIIKETFDAFVEKVHLALPETRIYVLAIKPSILRWNIWNAMEEANALLEAECEDNPLLTFIDVASPMLDATGAPLADLFIQDNLHMNAKGYGIWREVVRPILVQHESAFEK